jgi:hypothetical protein
MAEDKLTGNMPTEHLLRYLKNQDADLHIDEINFSEALQMAAEIFNSFSVKVK